MKELWNSLTRQKRYALLVKAYPSRPYQIHNYEAKLKWQELLPSTQLELRRLLEEAKQ